jgi:cytochrome c biogenesis protein
MSNKWIKPTISRLTSMATAIYLLIIIGAISALGTFIPQGQNQSFYTDHYGPWAGSLITHLALHQLYQSWWFKLLIVLLSLSILLCVYQRLRHIRSRLILASLIMHSAIILVLIGAAWSLGYANSTMVEVAEGQTVSLAPYGFQDAHLTLNRFNIDYYPDYQPRQYSSEIFLENYQGHDYRQRIVVNHPLKTGALKIYQSSWGWSLDLSYHLDRSENTEVTVRDRDIYWLDKNQNLKVQAVFIPDLDENHVGIRSASPLPRNPHVWLTLLHKDKVADMTLLARGESGQLGEYQMCLEGFSYYSGLIIKEDRGVYLVFTGFILLLLGMVGRYWSVFLPRKVG